MRYIKIPTHHFTKKWKCVADPTRYQSCEPSERRTLIYYPEHDSCTWHMVLNAVTPVFLEYERMED